MTKNILFMSVVFALVNFSAYPKYKIMDIAEYV